MNLSDFFYKKVSKNIKLIRNTAPNCIKRVYALALLHSVIFRSRHNLKKSPTMSVSRNSRFQTRRPPHKTKTNHIEKVITDFKEAVHINPIEKCTICSRKITAILCKKCSKFMIGRLKVKCPLHPSVSFHVSLQQKNPVAILI